MGYHDIHQWFLRLQNGEYFGPFDTKEQMTNFYKDFLWKR